MTQGEKTSKLKDIKETVFGAVEIVRQARTPEAQESFGKMIDTAMIARQIIDALKTPEMVKNIENFRLISDNINESTTKIQNTLKQLEETGVIDEATGLIKSIKSTMGSFGDNGQDLLKTSTAVMEILRTIKTAQETIHTVRNVAEHIRHKII
ncbi:MAG: hypothetical protein E6K91_05805 [Thaumarchaeota archaeon]|nr:MAG: hypothetical protein E6K91_05805 [Nitrososphaerota archaeon]